MSFISHKLILSRSFVAAAKYRTQGFLKPQTFGRHAKLCLSSTSDTSKGGNIFSADGVDIVDPPSNEPEIPNYINIFNRYGPKNESLECKRARLLYQSRKRGMLENCLLLSTFACKNLESMDESQLKLYDELINGETNDWQIYYWMVGQKETPKEYDHQVMDMLKFHAKNVDKEARIRQPDLY